MADENTKLPKPNKPLGAQPDDAKHQAAEDIETQDEQDFAGGSPDPEIVTGADQDEPKTVDDMAHQVGIGHQSSDEGEGKIDELHSEQDLEEDEQEAWES